VKRLPINVEGRRSASGAVPWVQRRTWRGARLKDRLCRVQPVPSGSGVDDVCAAIKWAYEEFESLRTTFPIGENGELYQRVEAHSSADILLVESNAASIETDIDDSVHSFMSDRHDPATDLPVIFAIVTVADTPTHIITAASHLALDVLGFVALGSYLSEYLANGRPSHPAGSSLQSIEQARFEQSASGKVKSRVALGYWKEMLEKCPIEDELNRSAVMDSPGRTARRLDDLQELWRRYTLCFRAGAAVVAGALIRRETCSLVRRPSRSLGRHRNRIAQGLLPELQPLLLGSCSGRLEAAPADGLRNRSRLLFSGHTRRAAVAVRQRLPGRVSQWLTAVLQNGDRDRSNRRRHGG